MNQEQAASAVLQFWFGELDQYGLPDPKRQKRWFNPPEGTDAEIRREFGPAVEQALEGRLDVWSASGSGRVALVILLDQFTRNIYRGTPRAFAGDAKALSLARRALNAEGYAALPLIYRVFLCVPFEHAEDLAAQEEGIHWMNTLLDDCPESARPLIENFRRYALAHRAVIERFGRFPHRNNILGRRSHSEELAWLKKHGGF